ncbi:hypothetical protein [Paenibacillus etheri]|uniref:Uncharacterized protein n=1 Tax=Paenibacillus etheri TaxID=1306852 RepID=A0A0W1ATY1_9BACL|nr:hypothetical protein [Paenibacillus etheri]KTD84767.1 hypothetical protein UQ64_24310 [Paenibacillus etheri]
MIHVPNYSISHKGSIFKPILLGNEKALTHQRIVSIGLQLLLCVVLLLHAVYAAILYTIGPRQKMLIYFFLLVISAITTVLIDDDKLLLHMLPLNYQWRLKQLELVRGQDEHQLGFSRKSTFLVTALDHSATR